MPQNILTFCGNVKLCEIDNSHYRTLNYVDTLTASSSLRQLKEIELLIAKNRGSATYYTPVPHFMASLSQSTEWHMSLSQEQTVKIDGTRQASSIIGELPSDLLAIVQKLGKRVKTEIMEQTILKLCSWKSLSSEDLAEILQRDKIKLTRVYLTPMVDKKLLLYKFPEKPKHPNQAYYAKK